MSFVVAAPEIMVDAAANLAGIGSTIDTANAAAAAHTIEMLSGSQQTAVVPSIFGGFFNTGVEPFLQHPIYLGYSPTGSGTIVFDTSPTG